MPDIPCPCCGFLTLENQYGLYVICDVCDWEDDAVQLANPTSEGGANRESLAESQLAALTKYPASVEVGGDYRRSRRWHPLLESEVEAANKRKAVKHWHSPAVITESDAYWGHCNEQG